MKSPSIEEIISILREDSPLLEFLESLNARYYPSDNRIRCPNYEKTHTTAVIFQSYSRKYPDLFKIIEEFKYEKYDSENYLSKSLKDLITLQ